MFSDLSNFTRSIKEKQNIKVENQFVILKIYIMETVILNDAIQDLEEIIDVTLIMKIVGTRVAI